MLDDGDVPYMVSFRSSSNPRTWSAPRCPYHFWQHSLSLRLDFTSLFFLSQSLSFSHMVQ